MWKVIFSFRLHDISNFFTNIPTEKAFNLLDNMVYSLGQK